MKPAILQCLQQFAIKNSKNVYHEKFIEKWKLQSHCKIVENVRFSLYIPRFMKTAILQCLEQFSSKSSKNVYHKIIKIWKLRWHCKVVQNVRFSL